MLTVLTVAPLLAGVAPLANADMVQEVVALFDPAPAIDGWVHETPTVQLVCTPEPCTMRYALGAGDFANYTAPFTLPDGDHALALEATDGNVSWFGTASIAVDTVAPTANVSSLCWTDAPAVNGWCADAADVFVENVSDDFSGVVDVVCTVDGQVVACSEECGVACEQGPQCEVECASTPCAYGCAFSVQGEGVHEVRVSITDDAGNVAVVSHVVRIDGTPPTPPTLLCVELAEGGYCLKANVTAASDAVSGVANASCVLNDLTLEACPVGTLAADLQGYLVLSSDATDVAGNFATNGSEVWIDSVAPLLGLDVACDLPGTNGWCLAPVNVTASAYDASSGLASFHCGVEGQETSCFRRFLVETDGEQFLTQSCICGPTFTFNVTQDGETNVTANATDEAGHENATRTTVRVDQTPPVPGELVCPTAAVDGVCPALLVYVPATDDASGIAGESCFVGADEVDCASPFPREGTFDFTAKATDAAGLNATRLQAGLRVDVTAPTASIETACALPGIGAWCRASGYAFWMNATDGDAEVAAIVCKLDGETLEACSGTVTGEGPHVLNLTVVDSVGRFAYAERALGIDSLAPSVLDLPAPATMGLEGLGARLTFFFSEPMDRASTEAALVGADGWTRAWDDGSRWLNLTLPVVGDRTLLEVGVGASAKDPQGNALSAARTISMPLAYRYDVIPYGFVNLSADGTNANIVCDDCGARVELPFAFAYYGRVYREINVSSNGFVDFGTNTCYIGTYTPVPFPGSCYGIAAPFWEDLDTRSCGQPQGVIRSKTLGEAPHRTFVVSWDQVWHYSCNRILATFQLQLHEGSNHIEFHYEDARSDTGNHMIGVINQNGTRHTPYAYRPIDLAQFALRFSAADTLPDSTPPTLVVSGTVGTVRQPLAEVTFTFSEPMDQEETLAALTGAQGWTTEWTSPSVLVASTSQLPVGTTTLTMGTRAADASGVHLQQSVSRSITYAPDVTAPILAAMEDLVAELEGPEGAAVTYEPPSWTDDSGESGVATCEPASGAVFPPGATNVTCQATDSAGNARQASFLVTVRDTTPPSIAPRADLTVESTRVDGALVAYDPPAYTDASCANGTADCSPASGSLFPMGATAVHCSATDASNNTGASTFTVNVVDTVAPTVNVSGSEGLVPSGEASVNFTFSEPMDREATSAALENATNWTLTWNEDATRLTANRSGLPFGVTTLTLTTAARDAHGVPLAAPANRTMERSAPPAAPRDPPAPPPTAPDAPAALTALVDGANVTLTWSPPAQTNGAAVTAYRVHRDGAFVAETTGTRHVFEALPRGASYALSVTAVNAAGESAPSLVSVALLPTSTLRVTPPSASGWHLAQPVLTFTTDPADATVLVDLGDGLGERAYTPDLAFPHGETLLRWRASSNGLAEAPSETRIRHDPDAPSIGGVEVSPARLAPGGTLRIAARVTDAASGVASVVAQVGPLSLPLTAGDDGAYHGTTTPTEGAAVTIVARDAAGHEARANAGAFTVDLLPEEETPEDTTSGGSIPLETTSTGGGIGGDGGGSTPSGADPTPSTPGTSGAPEEQGEPEAEPLPPEVVFDQETGAGIQGIVRISVANFPELPRLRIVLIHPNGTEELLSQGQETTEWDTTVAPDGFYVVEARLGPAPVAANALTIQSSHANGETLAAMRVLVRNDVAVPVETAAVVVGAVAFTAVTHAGLSAAASATGSATSASLGGAGGFDPLGFAQEVAIDAGQDKLRDKTKDKASLERRRRIRSIVVAILGIVILGALWAFSETEGWSARQWLLALPLVGTAAALVTLMKYSSESALAYVTHARPRIRLWVAGTISLALSSIVFRNPFGYPAWVDETEESESRRTWKRQALRALATLAGAAAFLLPFLALAQVAPWTFVSVGVLIALTNLATSAMPFGPLPGKDIWRWNKGLAVGVAVAAFAIYVAYSAALAPMWVFWALGLVGAAGYAGGLVAFRRSMGPRPRRVPVAVSVPVRDADPAPARTLTPGVDVESQRGAKERTRGKKKR